jgi:hypothetical protein
MKIFQNNISQKSISFILIITVVFLTIGPILLLPKKVKAVGGCPVVVSASAPQSSGNKKDMFFRAIDKAYQKGGLAQATITAGEMVAQNATKIAESTAGVLLNSLLHQLAAQLTNDIVNWIQNGKEPRFISEGLMPYLKDTADKAVGNFIDQYLGAGWLCEPFDLDIKIALLDVPTFGTQVKCTLSDMGKNIQNFYDDFSQGGWKEWIELAKPQNNFYGALLLAQDEKARVKAEAEKEAEAEAQMGKGFLKFQDCIWYDKSGKKVAEQKNVRGEPSLPNDCKPDPKNPGKTIGGFDAPCKKSCQTLTPPSIISEMANETVTDFQKTIRQQIGAATVKAGPYQVYVQAIVNALINRVMKEGIGLLKGGPQPIPGYKNKGASISIPKTISPESVSQNKDDAKTLSAQLKLNKENLKNELLKEQKTNLALMKKIPPAYLNVTPDLDNVINICSSTPYSSYVTWANNKKDEINDSIIPSYNKRINQLKTVDIVKTINLVNDINTALASIQDYDNQADNWLAIHKEVNGEKNDPKLKAAETEMNKAKNKVITDTQKVLKSINGTVTSTDIKGLTNESMNTNTIIAGLAIDLEKERGIAAFPDPGTLYAELEATNNLKSEANTKINTCQDWIVEEDSV